MADTSFAVNAGSGTNLHTVTTSIGGTTVHDQVVKHGEPYLAAYGIASVSAISLATVNDHILQIMAGSTLNVYVRRIRVYQVVAATTAGFSQIVLYRLSTAGTGGTSITPSLFDTTDSAAGCTAMSLPTAKGTETVVLGRAAKILEQTAPTSGVDVLVAEWNFDHLRTKGIRIPAGTANGIAIKSVVAAAGASVQVEAVVSEANF